MNTRMYCLVAILLFVKGIAHADDFQAGKSTVLFKSPTTGKWTASRVHDRPSSDRIRVSEQVFESNHYYEKYWDISSKQVLREVSDPSAHLPQGELCLASPTDRLEAGARIKVNHVYENQMADIERGGAIGRLLSVFQFPEVVDLKQLVPCDGADHQARVTERRQPQRAPSVISGSEIESSSEIGFASAAK